MILCLLGTNPYDFSRLAKAVDELAKDLEEDVVIQLGNTKYIPKYCKYFDFASKNEIEKLMKEADIVITQGGYGSMTDAIILNKKVIAVPRLQKLKEAQDNQVELVEYYDSKGYVKACFDVNELKNFIKKIREKKIVFKPYENENIKKISTLIKEYIYEN